jgi:ferrous iron transport protein A
MCLKLSDCAIGEDIEIVKIEDGDIASKMIEMGLTEKLITKVVLIAPLGDPIAIDINGFILSMRKSEAQHVLVKKHRVN